MAGKCVRALYMCVGVDAGPPWREAEDASISLLAAWPPTPSLNQATAIAFVLSLQTLCKVHKSVLDHLRGRGLNARAQGRSAKSEFGHQKQRQGT